MNIYKLEKNKINGINIPENSIVCTIQDKITIRLIGESTPFIEAYLEEFRNSADAVFADQAAFITYFNLNFNTGISLNGSDIEIGAVELKDGLTDQRATITLIGTKGVLSTQVVDAAGNQITSFGSPSTVADYRSPSDFTAAYDTTSTILLGGYNFQLDTGVQIVYIRQRNMVTNISNVYVNGASGYSFKFDTATSKITLYKDGGLAALLSADDSYEVGINSSTKAYDPISDSNKSFVNNYPVQPIQLDILDTTNIPAATNYYPSSDGIDMGIHNNFSLSGYILDADGVITMTLEGTNDEDLATGDWHTIYAYNLITNAQEASWAVTNTGLYFALILKDCKFNNIRIKVVNNGATNTMRLKGRLTY